MIIIGIDPGASSGGIAVLRDGPPATLSLKSATERDIHLWLDSAVYWAEEQYHGGGIFAWIEQVHAMPKQGVSSSFAFGRNYGFLRGAVTGLGIPFEEVPPHIWQGAMKCRSRGNKNTTKARAQQLFPQVTITHANADALLIAEYGRRVINQRNGVRE